MTQVHRKCGTSKTSAIWVRHEPHNCDTSATQTVRVQHKWKTSISIMTQVKTYFHFPILTTWQMKDHKKRNNSILKVHSQIWDIFGNWKPFQNEKMLFISPQKLFSFSKYLSFCLDFLVMYQNGLIRKIRLISNFTHHSLFKEQL